jgi:hypothetical protein
MREHRRRVLTLAPVVAGSLHRDDTITFAEPSKPNEPALSAANDRDAAVGVPYMPIEWSTFRFPTPVHFSVPVDISNVAVTPRSVTEPEEAARGPFRAPSRDR